MESVSMAFMANVAAFAIGFSAVIFPRAIRSRVRS